MADFTLLIDCAVDEAPAVREALEVTGADVQASEKHMLDGSTATAWVMVATSAITTGPAMVNALKDFLRRDAVSSITVGGVTITNPRPEDVATLLGQVPQSE